MICLRAIIVSSTVRWLSPYVPVWIIPAGFDHGLSAADIAVSYLDVASPSKILFNVRRTEPAVSDVRECAVHRIFSARGLRLYRNADLKLHFDEYILPHVDDNSILLLEERDKIRSC